MKRKWLQIWSIAMIVIMITTMLPAPAPVRASKNQKTDALLTRVEWIKELATVFDMSVEEHNYPDNYYSDINKEDEYYYYVMLAVEFGLIDIEAGQEFKPNEPVTREFAAHTMNHCLGFELEEKTYTFLDTEEVKYKDDAQVAITRGWISPIDGMFCPSTALTREEMQVMISDAIEVRENARIDENHKNVYQFEDGVVIVPEDTRVEVSVDQVVTIYDCPVKISVGETFVVLTNGLPASYIAKAIVVEGNKTVITTKEADLKDAVTGMDAEGIVEANLGQAEAIGDTLVTYIVGGTEAAGYEDGTKYPSQKLAGSKKISAITAEKTITLRNGLSVSVKCVISDVSVDYKVKTFSFNREIFIKLSGTSTVSCTVKKDVKSEIGGTETFPLVILPVAGVGSITISAKLGVSGQISLTYSSDFVSGVEYVPGRGFRDLKEFTKKSFSIEAQVTAYAGVELALGVNLLQVVRGKIYAAMGAKANYTSTSYDDGKSPINCTTFKVWMEATVGASVTLDLIAFELPYSKENKIVSESNSPVRVVNHYEDSRYVTCCSRNKHGYYTPIDSQYGSVGSYEGTTSNGGTSGGGTSGGGTSTKPVLPTYSYRVESDGTATITKYNRDAKSIIIPSKLGGHTVTRIGYEAFKGKKGLVSVVIPDTVTAINTAAFLGCSNLFNLSLSDNITTLESKAFGDCTSLTQVTIPKSLDDCRTTVNSSENYLDGPFYGCSSLNHITFEKGTTKIPMNLMAGCNGLTKIEIPDTVTEIGSKAFAATNLKSVVIPDAVKNIELATFYNCANLSKVTLPSELEDMARLAFGNCTSLTKIKLPKSLQKAHTSYDMLEDQNDGPFYGCSSLEEVTFEKGTTQIAQCLFAGCDGLKNIAIPDTVTRIGMKAFVSTEMKEIVIPNSVTMIDKAAFYDCKKLSKVTLSNSLEELEKIAFGKCSALTKIQIPKSLQMAYTSWVNLSEQADGPFMDCSSLEEVTFEKGTTQIAQCLFAGCNGFTKIVIPDTVTTIGMKAFASTKLTNVVIPDSVTIIAKGAFYNCVDLKKVTLSNCLEVMDEAAFGNNPLLTKIMIPKSLQTCNASYIGSVGYLTQGPFSGSSIEQVEFQTGTSRVSEALFAGCSTLTTIQIPDTVTSIGRKAFECSGLTSVALPANVNKIELAAFYGCEDLVKVTMGDLVTEIGRSVFYNCTNLNSIRLSKNVSVIENNLFRDTTSLQAITLPEGLTEIKESAFQNSRLTSITIPNEVEKIGQKAFYDCVDLASITLGTSVKTIGDYALYNCNKIQMMELGDSITTIGQYALSRCNALKEVMIGYGITKIPAYAFYECESLEKVTFSYRVSEIGDHAFANCVKLISMTIPRGMKFIDNSAFSYPAKTTFYGVEDSYAQSYAKSRGIKFVDKQQDAKEVTLSSTKLELKMYDKATLRVKVNPTEFTDELVFKSMDTSVVTIDDDGTIVAEGPGTTKIKVGVGNIVKECQVTVIQPVTSIYLNKSSLTMEALESYQLTANVYPSNANNKNLTWSSSNPAIASVDESGLVKAHGKGSVVITAATIDGSGKKGNCNVTVANNAHLVASVSELESPHNYQNNMSDVWIYTLNGASSIKVTFDERTSVEEGGDYLYLYDKNGKQIGSYTGDQLAGKSIQVAGDTIKIKLVSDKAFTDWGFKVTSVTEIIEKQPQRLSGTTSYSVTNESKPFYLDAMLTSGDGTLTYASDNSMVASVSKDGKVTVNGPGKATITVTASETEKYESASMRVVIQVTKVETIPDISLSDCQITMDSMSYIYDGYMKRPKVTVKNGKTTLTQGVHYMVEYSNNMYPGEAYATVSAVSGSGYTGSVKKAFHITKANQSLTGRKSYVATYGDSKFALDAAVLEGDGTLSYASSNEKAVSVDANGVITIHKAGTAVITVTASETGNYNRETMSITIVVNKVRVDLPSISGSYRYNGKVQKVTIKQNSAYKISGNSALKPGNYKAVVSLIDTERYEWKDGTTKPRELSWTMSKADQSVTASISSSTIKVSEKGQIKASCAGGKISYSVNNSNVLSVSASGAITAKNPGTAVITIKANETDCYKSATKKIQIKVEPNGLKKGEKINVSGITYRCLSTTTVEVVGLADKNKTSVTIPPTMKAKGKTYQVTKIADKAFQNNKKLKTVTIEKNVVTIGTMTFAGCKNLKTITVKSSSLKTIGKNALKDIHSKAQIKVPAKKLKDYTKLFGGKGQAKGVKVVK